MTPKTHSLFEGPRAFALLVLVLALVLRVWDLTSRSLWLDEAVEYWTATSPLAQMPAYVRAIIQDPPLYSFLLHVWMIPTDHEAWMRLLSVVFGMGSVAGVMVLGYRLGGWLPALGAGSLMAIIPTAIHYSQEVGQYAPMQCFIVWSAVALLDVARAPTRERYVRWGVVAAAAMYTYYGTVLPVVIPFLCFVVESAMQRDRARTRAGLITLLAVFVAVLPLLLYFIPSQLHRGPTERGLDPGHVSSLTQGAASFLKALKVTIGFWFTGWPSTPVSEWLTIALFVVLLVLATRMQRRFATWVGATVLVYALIGWLHLFPFGFRHSLILVPLFVPLVACSLRVPNARVYRAAAALVFVALCVCAILSPTNRDLRTRWFGTSHALWPETEDIGAATRYWAEHRAPGQPTYVYYAAAPAFAYYAQQYTHEQIARPPDWFLQCWRNQDAPFCRDGSVYYGRWLRSLKPEEKAQSIFETMNQVPNEFWFVMAHSQKLEQTTIGAMLHQYFDFADRVTLDDAGAVLLRRNATPPESKTPTTTP